MNFLAELLWKNEIYFPNVKVNKSKRLIKCEKIWWLGTFTGCAKIPYIRKRK